jgi:hypothetical protein
MATRTARTEDSPKSKKLSHQLAVSIVDGEHSCRPAMGAKPLMVLARLLGRQAAREASRV